MSLSNILAAQTNLISYEYWFNNDYENVQVHAITPARQHLLNTNLDVSALPENVNVLNVRYKDDNGLYSTTLSKLFMKLPTAEAPGTPRLVSYEYWFNNDYENAQTVTISPTQTHLLNTNLDVSALPENVNVLNVRYKDDNGLYSTTLSKLFVKMSTPLVRSNKIVAYQYWIDDDFANRKFINLTTPLQQINVLGDFDMTHIARGNHTFYIQFLDTFGVWSVVNHHNFEKLSYPISDFDYTLAANCTSTTVTFINKSIDGDAYLWDFGDGNTSDLENPSHTFYTPQTYQVSLKVTDSSSGSNTIELPVVINSLQTSSTINVTACESYTAPDGQVHTTSGVKTAILPNQAGCDSTITINLTINTVDVSVTQNGLMLTANATADFYQWLDCNNGHSIIEGETRQSFTATNNGSYAVEITQNNCIDTSACYTITTLGVLENTFSNGLTVYPNPTRGIVTIDLGEYLSEFIVNINDINGKLIRQSTYKNTKRFKLNLDVDSGIYFMTIKSRNKAATIRFVKY
jgi:hypothetical protein